MQITITNKWLYTLSLIFLLTLVFSVYAYSAVPNPGHGGDRVWVNVEGQELSLQSAIDQGLIYSPDDIQKPPTCAENELISYNTTGTNNWECIKSPQMECRVCISKDGGRRGEVPPGFVGDSLSGYCSGWVTIGERAMTPRIVDHGDTGKEESIGLECREVN